MPAHGGCARLASAAPDVDLPSSCAALNGRLDGFKRQRCVGDSFATGMMLPPDDAPSLQEASVAAICLSQHLVDTQLLDDCHLVAHSVGHALWQRYASSNDVSTGKQLALAASQLAPRCPSNLCSDGCLHAVMIELLRATLRAGQALSTARPMIDVACGSATRTVALRNSGQGASDAARWDYGCYHGVGHGLGALTFDRTIALADARALCTTLAPTVPLSKACVGGLIMELVDSRLQAAADTPAADKPLPPGQGVHNNNSNALLERLVSQSHTGPAAGQGSNLNPAAGLRVVGW